MASNLRLALTAIAATAFVMLSWKSPARASGSVGSISPTGIRITYQHPGYTAHGLPLYRGYKYHVCIGSLIKGETCTNGNSQSLDYYGLVAGTTYRIVVWCGCRGSSRFAVPIPIRLMDVQYTHSEPAPTPEPAPQPAPQPGDIRLRHEATGKCLFGNPVDGGAVKTWGACWQDPGMAVSLEPVNGSLQPLDRSEVRIRLRANGKCLFGSPLDGGEVKNWACWNDPNMVFVVEVVNNNRVRLRHRATGRCMYGSPVNGGVVRNWTCWNDPNMVWVIDPF